MKKNDWVGLGVSMGLHLLLLLMFSVMSMAAVEEQPLGFIEVDFGPIAEGRPVRRAETPQPAEVEKPPEPEVKPEPKPATPPPKEVKPVELPDPPKEVVDVDKVKTPEAESIAPQATPEKKPTPKPEQTERPQPIRPLGGGTPEGTTGETKTDDGPGAEDKKAAPFQIEGLNRVPVFNPIPDYRAQVNAVISVRVTVDPKGNVVSRSPLIKGNPALESAVMDALRRWRFNPLPPNAPQENQTGVITFRFRLE